MTAPPDFNRLARLYRWMELLTFGPWLWRCRCAFLPDLASKPTLRITLILGDGDGRFTARLLRDHPTLQIDAVDASSAMLQSLLCRAGSHASRVQIHHADARQFHPPNPPYDLIVTHFFLDCLTTAEVQSLAATVRPASALNAHWLVSEFAIPPNLFGRLVARPLVWLLYLAFGRLTGLTLSHLPDYASALSQSGFTLQKQFTWLAGLLVSQLWSASHSNH